MGQKENKPLFQQSKAEQTQDPQFTVAPFTEAKTWKQPIDIGMGKEVVVHTYDGILAIKRRRCHLQQHGWT